MKVLWRDASGKAWRIPHDWRRRRIRLPAYDVLLENDVPPDVAEEFAGKAVSVNYPPGSLCCLPDGYRFRDGHGGRWPIRAIDCLLLGYGARDERLARGLCYWTTKIYVSPRCVEDAEVRNRHARSGS